MSLNYPVLRCVAREKFGLRGRTRTYINYDLEDRCLSFRLRAGKYGRQHNESNVFCVGLQPRRDPTSPVAEIKMAESGVIETQALIALDWFSKPSPTPAGFTLLNYGGQPEI